MVEKDAFPYLDMQNVMGKQQPEFLGVQSGKPDDKVCEQRELSQDFSVQSGARRSVHTACSTYLANPGKQKHTHHGFIPLHTEALNKAKLLPKKIPAVNDLYQQEDDRRQRSKKKEEEKAKKQDKGLFSL